MPLVLGIDSSTGAAKAELRDAEDGTVVGTGRAPHPAADPPRSEQDPSAWWEALGQAVDEATRGGRHRAAAVSVAAQQHGMVVLDGGGRVLRPAKLWNDTESAPDAERLVAELGAAEWARRTGSVPRAAFTVTKLAWLARCEPSVAADVRSVLLSHDYLTFRLSGRKVTDRGDASGTGYLDPTTGRWLPDLLRRFAGPGDWERRLPEVLGPTEASGRLHGDGLELVGLEADAVVGPGTGDNMAAALGLGLPRGRLCLSLGTSGTAYADHDRPTADPSGDVAGFADASGAFLPLACTLNATRVTDAVARLLGVGPAELDALALEADPGASGVVLVPYFDGERTPDRPTATGSIVGLRTDVARSDLARAAVEGVVCGLLEAADALGAVASIEPGIVVLVGGGARSVAFRTVVADLAGRTVLVPEAEEAVATGAGVQAAAVLLGCPISDVQEAWGLGQGMIVEPASGDDAVTVRRAYASARG